MKFALHFVWAWLTTRNSIYKSYKESAPRWWRPRSLRAVGSQREPRGRADSCSLSVEARAHGEPGRGCPSAAQPKGRRRPSFRQAGRGHPCSVGLLFYSGFHLTWYGRPHWRTISLRSPQMQAPVSPRSTLTGTPGGVSNHVPGHSWTEPSHVLAAKSSGAGFVFCTYLHSRNYNAESQVKKREQLIIITTSPFREFVFLSPHQLFMKVAMAM